MRRRRFGWPCRRRPWCRRFGPWGSRVSSRRRHSGSRRGRLGSPKRRWDVTPGPAPKRRIARGWCHRMDRSRLFRLVRWRTCTRGAVARLDEQDQTTQCQRRRRATDCHDPFRSPARPARSGLFHPWTAHLPLSFMCHSSGPRAGLALEYRAMSARARPDSRRGQPTVHGVLVGCERSLLILVHGAANSEGVDFLGARARAPWPDLSRPRSPAVTGTVNPSI